MFRVIVMLLCFLVVAEDQAGNVTCQQHQCLAVVDAGSTGSRLHIYAYDLDSKNNPVKINQVWYKKIEGGVSLVDPEKMSDYLSDLLDDAPEQVMPMYFYATGGMRLLPQHEQLMRFQRLQDWFQKQSKWNLVDFKTISGQEEGLFGWLSINYRLGAFTTDKQSMVGLMDMGGASVQVAFPVYHSDGIDSNDLVDVDVNGQHFSLFVRSFLGLGQTEIIKEFLGDERCFPNQYLMSNGVSGQGDAVICQQNISALIRTRDEVDSIVKPAIASNPVSTWYAMSGLSMLVLEKPFQFSDNQMTSQTLLQQADKKICQQEWTNLHEQDPNNTRTYAFCLISSYYYALLVDGYGLKPTETVHFLPEKQNADWSLGVVLHHD